MSALDEDLTAAAARLRAGGPVTLTPAVANELAVALEAVRWAVRLDEDLIHRVGYTELNLFANAFRNQPEGN